MRDLIDAVASGRLIRNAMRGSRSRGRRLNGPRAVLRPFFRTYDKISPNIKPRSEVSILGREGAL